MKAFIILVLAIAAVQASPRKAAKGGLPIKADRDCSCAGYEALAKECKWPEKIAKCDEKSETYNHYKNKCERLNKFRAGKRNGTHVNTHVSKMQCDAWKSSARRIKESTGYVEDKPKAQKRSLPQYINNDNTMTFYGMPPKLAGPALPAGTVSWNAPIAASVDWTSQFPPIKNQGSCGSCWIFASTGMCEWYLKNKSPKVQTIISEQSLVDCQGVNGCNGGDLKNSWNYITSTGASSSAYAYTGVFGTCKKATYPQINKCPKPIQEYWPSGNDTRLRQILSSRPVAVSFRVLDDIFQYTTGVYVPTQVCNASVNHAVILTGFGYDSVLKRNFWKIRNSWGTTRGEQGYYRLDANTPFQCGISRKIAYFP